MPTYNPQMGQQGYSNFPGAIPNQQWSPQPLGPQPQGPGPQMAQTAQAAAPQAGAGAGDMGIDPALVQAVLTLQGQSPQQAAMQRQLARADALRKAGPSMAQGVGGMPNYLGAIAEGVAAYKANQLDKETAATGETLGTQRQSAARTYFDALRKSKTKSQLPTDDDQ